MQQIAGFPFFPIEFTKEGSIFKPEQLAELDGFLGSPADGKAVTDLLVLSHGWNNNIEDATRLYTGLLTSIAAQAPGFPSFADRRTAVMGIFWPSKRFTDRDLIPGGGAAAVTEVEQPQQDDLHQQLGELEDTFLNAPAAAPVPDSVSGGLALARKSLPDIEDDDKGKLARRSFIQGLRAAMNPERGAILGQGEPDSAALFLYADADDVWENLLAMPLLEESEENSGGALGLGDGLSDGLGGGDASGSGASLIGDLLDKFRTGAEIVMNLTTYYTMKARAGSVGQGGAFQALQSIAKKHPEVRIHLVGHSFGGRLAAAIALGPDGSEAIPLSSLTLLQAAFSHNGLSPDFPTPAGGFFRRILEEKRVAGPIVISYTRNDIAVGYAYPLASRLAHDPARAFGDSNDPFGGLGRNGALHLDGAVDATQGTLLDIDGSYAFRPGRVYNLNADAFIKGHSDITGLQVACAILSAVTTPETQSKQPE